MAKRKPPKGSDIPEWVVTYGDLMSLLLCFFILLVAFSEPKKPDEFRKVLQKIQEALGFKGGIGVNDIEIQSANAEITVKTNQVNRGDDKSFSNEAPTKNITGVAEKATIVQEGELQVIGGALPFAGGKRRSHRGCQARAPREHRGSDPRSAVHHPDCRAFVGHGGPDHGQPRRGGVPSSRSR